ncbi:MAG: hypothetical protein ACLR4Z_09665 [Butyricicoccaceae bacterium]
MRLKDLPLPEGVVLADTPGLNDAVEYRSNITKDYIDRANAVFVCVKADRLSGQELATIYGVFSNARYNPEKIYIIATQQDSLNNPVETGASSVLSGWISQGTGVLRRTGACRAQSDFNLGLLLYAAARHGDI